MYVIRHPDRGVAVGRDDHSHRLHFSTTRPREHALRFETRDDAVDVLRRRANEGVRCACRILNAGTWRPTRTKVCL